MIRGAVVGARPSLSQEADRWFVLGPAAERLLVQGPSRETSYPETDGDRSILPEAVPTTLLPPPTPRQASSLPACFTARSPVSLLSPETFPVRSLLLEPRAHFCRVQPERSGRPAHSSLSSGPRGRGEALGLANSCDHTWPSWLRTADSLPRAGTPPREPPAHPLHLSPFSHASPVPALSAG